jgi:pimeloyl-ACP methyl ester carboxylesterase
VHNGWGYSLYPFDRQIVAFDQTIAAWMAIDASERFGGVILEALHFYRSKPLSSAEMLAQLAENPDRIGERVSSLLAVEHGEDHWRDLIVANSRAWLELGATSPHPKADLFDGRLSELRAPTLIIHGSRDPRTEPDELDSVRRACPQAHMHIIDGGAHSPHTESASFEECNKVAAEFLLQIGVPSAAAR